MMKWLQKQLGGSVSLARLNCNCNLSFSLPRYGFCKTSKEICLGNFVTSFFENACSLWFTKLSICCERLLVIFCWSFLLSSSVILAFNTAISWTWPKLRYLYVLDEDFWHVFSKPFREKSILPHIKVGEFRYHIISYDWCTRFYVSVLIYIYSPINTTFWTWVLSTYLYLPLWCFFPKRFLLLQFHMSPPGVPDKLTCRTSLFGYGFLYHRTADDWHPIPIHR